MAEISAKEIEEIRKKHIDGERFSGRLDAVNIASFSEELFAVGFTSTEVVQMVLKKMENERDVQIVYIQKEMNENISGVKVEEEECDCPQCTKERESSDTTTL